ncbi:alpha/beta fold hydrolase [Paenibacillus lupini]|uniref:alpha/beta fold hydrolase n=1 Tax=Paenibacillus lupini TaxID=1450204 RepID=UPI00141F0F4C|nr:alpha/beta fold hydrolase [Paenibacillus lupini]NIK22686.1 pimeloyl-ACP methyl ester carboxylesterase [Paenibacillus lupini]
MSTFILVHGSWHGAWCWTKLVPLLEKEGHKVVTFDLPGHGLDKSPVQEIKLKNYTDSLTSILDSQTEQVILIGHSMAGLVITQTAEYRPEKIKSLVYLCAYLPKNEQTLLQISQSEKKDKPSDTPSAVIFSNDHVFMDLDKDLVQANFYGDCSESDVNYAKARVCLEPLAPFFEPVHLTDQHAESIPRFYIETLKDKAISIGLQRQMLADKPCKEVISMNSDHSPFFSHPEALAAHLNRLA